ncbi:MAG: hypothetical protein LVQ75_04595 [Candidatus Babeliales bacterium]
MSKKLVLGILLGSVCSAWASQWQPIGTFKQGDIFGYLAKSPDETKVLFIVCFPEEHYSGQVRVAADVFPMDAQGQKALRNKFKELGQLWKKHNGQDNKKIIKYQRLGYKKSISSSISSFSWSGN